MPRSSSSPKDGDWQISGRAGIGGRAYAAIASLRTPEAVRERCAEICAAGERGRLSHFALALDRLPEAARFVAATIRKNYPDLDIPYHSRWRHFHDGVRDRWPPIAAHLDGQSPEEIARTRFDLAVTSVLLDAGSGAGWTYIDRSSGRRFARSEGLAIASLELFATGGFSAREASPYRADAGALTAIDTARLNAAFQVTPDNPLGGMRGRVALLNGLGAALVAQPHYFGAQNPRVGNFFDHLCRSSGDGRLAARDVLVAVLEAFAPIWPGRIVIEGHNLGDVWRHHAVERNDASDALVPFHKLSQWLTYSLIEPLEEAGIEVMDLDALTGLAEYRNGGLFIDLGVIRPVDARALERTHTVDSTLVVEWRALTVALLDRLAPLVRDVLGVDDRRLPLARMLQGGTWSAGRRIAAERRADARPPIEIRSDGTVF